MKRSEIKSTIVNLAFIAGFIACALSCVASHGAEANVRIRPTPPEQQYEICNTEGKECRMGNSADATVAGLQGKGRIFKVVRTEMIVEAAKNGLSLKKK